MRSETTTLLLVQIPQELKKYLTYRGTKAKGGLLIVGYDLTTALRPSFLQKNPPLSGKKPIHTPWPPTSVDEHAAVISLRQLDIDRFVRCSDFSKACSRINTLVSFKLRALSTFTILLDLGE